MHTFITLLVAFVCSFVGAGIGFAITACLILRKK